jgi:hypothetical protein
MQFSEGYKEEKTKWLSTMYGLGEIQDGDWDRAADLLSSWTRDSAETLETCLAEV